MGIDPNPYSSPLAPGASQRTENERRYGLRAVLYTHLASVALVGAFTRGWLALPESTPTVIVGAGGLAAILMLPGFPAAVVWMLFRERPPVRNLFSAVVVEAALTWAWFIALLPAVQ
jgi:hypothetical protein